MLSLELLDKFSWVLSLITFSRGIPYAWDPFLQRMSIGSLHHLLAWLLIFLHSWAHFSLVSIRLFLSFSILPSPQKAIHILWVCASSLQAILQLPFLLQSQEILDFFNLLTKESTAIAGMVYNSPKTITRNYTTTSSLYYFRKTPTKKHLLQVPNEKTRASPFIHPVCFRWSSPYLPSVYLGHLLLQSTPVSVSICFTSPRNPGVSYYPPSNSL